MGECSRSTRRVLLAKERTILYTKESVRSYGSRTKLYLRLPLPPSQSYSRHKSARSFVHSCIISVHSSPRPLSTGSVQLAATRSSEVGKTSSPCSIIYISRRSDVPPKAPTWTRFKVDGIRRITLTDLHAAFSDNPGYQPFGEARMRQIQEAKRRGPGNGMLDIWISCLFGGGTMQAAYPQFFGPQVADSDYLPPGMTHTSYFKTVVEALSAQASK